MGFERQVSGELSPAEPWGDGEGERELLFWLALLRAQTQQLGGKGEVPPYLQPSAIPLMPRPKMLQAAAVHYSNAAMVHPRDGCPLTGDRLYSPLGKHFVI